MLEEFREVMIFGGFLISYRITCGKYFIDLKKNFWDFWNQLVEVLDVLWWNDWNIARKFWWNLRENEKKILTDSRKIVKL